MNAPDHMSRMVQKTLALPGASTHVNSRIDFWLGHCLRALSGVATTPTKETTTITGDEIKPPSALVSSLMRQGNGFPFPILDLGIDAMYVKARRTHDGRAWGQR